MSGYAQIRERVAAAAERSGRPCEAVKIVAIVKGRSVEQIEQAVRDGVTDVGENRVQELRAHRAAIGEAVTWHFVGAVQTNKVRWLDGVHLVHSLGRTQEAEAFQRRGELTGQSWDVLVEVNLAAEPTKQGVRAEDVEPFLERLASWPLVRPRGLMLVAPAASNPEDVRWVFAGARELRDRYRGEGIEELSMGMTDDFEVAIEEGATIVRIGRAIFEGGMGE